jgi:hypothetical protein
MNVNINENKYEINYKIIGLIVSENIIVPEELKLIVKANLYDINNIKKCLENIIKRNPEEKIKIMSNYFSQIKKILQKFG